MPFVSRFAHVPPVTYANEPLIRRIDRPGVRTLVPPNLLLYAPCAQQPRLAAGVVEVPDLILAQRDSLGPILGIGTGPFEGILDLYALTRLPLTDSDDPPGNVVLYQVDRRIPGTLEVPPAAVTET
jgi:hypothetical protein